MLISLGRISRRFFSPIRSTLCAAVKLGSEETEEKSICASVRSLVFSLLPSFSPNLQHPITLSLLRTFVLPQLVRGEQSILTPSTGQVRMSNIPWIHTFSLPPQPPAHKYQPRWPTHFALALLPSDLASIFQFFFSSYSLYSVAAVMDRTG